MTEYPGDEQAGYGRRGIAALNRRYGAGNLAVDPALKRNLRPRRSSPAVDAGVSLPADYPAFDRRGRPRARGRGPDIGAYELPALSRSSSR